MHDSFCRLTYFQAYFHIYGCLVNTSSSGKTRLLFEELLTTWGFYFTCSNKDHLGSSNVSEILRGILVTSGLSFTVILPSDVCLALWTCWCWQQYIFSFFASVASPSPHHPHPHCARSYTTTAKQICISSPENSHQNYLLLSFAHAHCSKLVVTSRGSKDQGPMFNRKIWWSPLILPSQGCCCCGCGLW